MRTPLIMLTLSLLAACAGDPSSSTPSDEPMSGDKSSMEAPEESEEPEQIAEESAESTKDADSPEDPIEAMRAAIKEVAARAEHKDPSLKVAHILVGVKSPNPRMAGFKYTAEEAEKVAADLYLKVVQGEDFIALMKANSDDPGGGVYPMTTSTRSGMVPGFGNVGWRLAVGEVGIAPPHATDSPFGYHIIKRVE